MEQAASVKGQILPANEPLINEQRMPHSEANKQNKKSGYLSPS